MNKFETHWQDFNSPLTRNEIWVAHMYLWPKILSLPFVPMGIVSRLDAISYFMDMATAQKYQRLFIGRIIKNPSVLFDIISKADKWGTELNKYTILVHKNNISSWSAKKLISFHKKFVELQRRQYAIGTPLVMLDTGVGRYDLEFAVKSILAKYLPTSKIDTIYHDLSNPTRESFARQQERELVPIYKKIVSSVKIKGKSSLSAESLLEIIKRSNKNIYSDLKKHSSKWAWLYYAYAGPEWSEIDFLAVIVDWLNRNIKPNLLLSKWNSELLYSQSKQKKIINSITSNIQEQKLLNLPSLVVWSKPHRKDYQSKSYWHMERYYLEVARRLGLSLRQVRSMPQTFLYKSLLTNNVNTTKLEEIYKFHVVVPGKSNSVVYSGSAAKNFLKQIKEDKYMIKGKVFTGTPACKGKVRARASIINSPQDMNKMKPGNVLVSVATTPSIVSAMRQASAILTDEGGLTCHAAIVSRELKIPCVVGLKFITQALKDGDMVEVDASKGIVKVIN